MTLSPTPAQELRRLIALAQVPALQEFLTRHPDWQELVDGTSTAWSRVLTTKNPRRAALLEVLLHHDLNPNRPLSFHGKTRYPLSVALQHGRYAAVERLLNAGAHARFRRHKKSPLEVLVANFDRHPVDASGSQVASAHLSALDSWLLRLRQSGAPLTPAFLALACERARKPDDAMWVLLEEGLAQGIWPAAPSTVAGYHLQHATGVLKWALLSESDAPLSYLTRALKKVPPSAAWAIELFEVARWGSTPKASRVQQVIDCVEEAWGLEDWDTPVRWTANVVDGWLQGLSPGRVNMERTLGFFLALKWGVNHGMPQHMLLADSRALARGFLHQAAGKRITMAVLHLLAERGLTLSSRIGSTPLSPGQTLLAFLERAQGAAWSVRSREIHQLFAEHRAKHLEGALDQASIAPTSRVRM